MTLSSRVIKRVDGDMEAWPVQVRNILARLDEDEPAVVVAQLPQEADLILHRARAKADLLISDTTTRINELEREALEKGYASGKQAALQDYQQAVEEYRRNSQNLLLQINQLHQKIYEDTEPEIIALALEIAQKLVCRQLEIDPATVVDVARSACMQAKECELVIIYAPPEQLDHLKNRKAEIQAQLYRAQKLEFIADPSITVGGCRIETEQGYIDATVDTMLEQIQAVIKEPD
jgi:flagellar assembly protein FliH